MLAVLSVLAFFLAGVEASKWAVLVNSSKFWYDYRHTSNMLTMYHALRRQGYPDSNIIVLNAGNSPCDARNVFPGQQYATPNHDLNLYNSVVVDYRGDQVSPGLVLQLLTNRLDDAVPVKKRLLSDVNADIVLYFTGHGGDGYMKFQDSEALTAQQLAAAISEMCIKQRYRTLTLVVDSCQAETLGAKITAPNVTVLASSSRGESSYSLFTDRVLGVPLVDRFTFVTDQLLRLASVSDLPMSKLTEVYEPDAVWSTPVLRGYDGDLSVGEIFSHSHLPVILDNTYLVTSIDRYIEL